MPDSLACLWEIMDEAPQARLYAGGTDLLVQMRAAPAHFENSHLICLERIDELKDITTGENEVSIGACAKLAHVCEYEAVQENFPALVMAIEVLGSPQIRNMGTIGGNICTASPAGDTLPPLYALSATLELLTKDGSRLVPLNEFISGPGKTALRPGEILSRIIIDRRGRWNLQHFEKVSGRKSLAIAVASLAVVARISNGGKIDAVRCAWGSVGPTVIMSRELEDFLIGRRLSHSDIQQAVAIIRSGCCAIDDIRAGAEYRRTVAGNLLLRLAKNINT